MGEGGVGNEEQSRCRVAERQHQCTDAVAVAMVVAVADAADAVGLGAVDVEAHKKWPGSHS